jgi:flagellar biosynthesis chaperone FliJ
MALEKPRDDAALRVENARKIYTEAHSKKAALEKLREKRMDQWKFQVKQDEIKRLDETAKGAASRRRLTGGEL